MLAKEFSFVFSIFRYFLKFGHFPHLKNPIDLNEKVIWLAFKTDTRKWSDLADKVKVRSFIRQCGLTHMEVPLLKVWNKAEDIHYKDLPNKFVLKTNNGCGDVFVIRNNQSVNLPLLRKKMGYYMKRHFGLWTGEPHYLKISPCIFAEELLKNDSEVSTSLIDYKFYCFYGVPKCILVCYDRKGLKAEKICYDLDWEMHLERTHIRKDAKIKNIPKPKSLNQMIEAASILSKDFPFVRIDFYESDGHAYFGEMTFTPAGGRSTALSSDYLTELGSYINISDIVEKK